MKNIGMITGMLAAAAVGMTSHPAMAADNGGAPVGSRIQRTMRLLATSTPERRNPVRILFYGQSIVRQDYARKAIEANLRERFPYADLTVENRAIGGYTAPALIRTAEHDLYPFYPDLLVFHVYGGEKGGQFEGILRNVRQRTTAEILTWTHHPDKRGIDHPGHEEACEHRRAMAEKYNCEMVDLRETWKTHLRDNDLAVDNFLVDVVHLNKEGGKLMGDILVQALQVHPEAPATWEEMVKEIPAGEAVNSGNDTITREGNWRVQGNGAVGQDGSIRLLFHGNRVDVTALRMGPDTTLGSATVLVDGKPVSAHPEAYAATLPTRTPIDYRPAIKHVILGDNPVVEDWTLVARDIRDDGQEFTYDVSGSVTGPDGTGTHEGTFVSSSGRIKLQPGDFSFAEAIRIRKQPLPASFEVTWSVYLMGTDTWQPKADVEPGKLDRTTLIQGIPNAEHTLEIRPAGDGLIPIQSFTVYQPPLRQNTP